MGRGNACSMGESHPIDKHLYGTTLIVQIHKVVPRPDRLSLGTAMGHVGVPWAQHPHTPTHTRIVR